MVICFLLMASTHEGLTQQPSGSKPTQVSPGSVSTPGRTPEIITPESRVADTSVPMRDGSDDSYEDGVRLRWVEGNPSGSLKLFESSARKGNLTSMRTLADMLLNGIGTARDVNKAFDWYILLACRYNDPGSQNQLGLMFINDQVPDQDDYREKHKEMAKYFFTLAVNNGSKLAEKNLNEFFPEG